MELTYHRKDYLFQNLTVQDEPMSIGKYRMLKDLSEGKQRRTGIRVC